MVALSGRTPSGHTWRLAPCLVALMAEVDRLWPNRSRVSDGSIGDAAHSARYSDHNPDSTLTVCAVDITEDPTNGPNLEVFWRDLIARHEPRLKYAIYERRIVASYPTSAPAWVPRPYSGVNAHLHHLHVSVLAAHKHDTRPWFTRSAPAGPTPTPDTQEDEDMLIVDCEGKPALVLAGDRIETLTSDERLGLRAAGVRADLVSVERYDAILSLRDKFTARFNGDMDKVFTYWAAAANEPLRVAIRAEVEDRFNALAAILRDIDEREPNPPAG